MRRLRTLLLPLRKIYTPWCDDVIAAVGDHHDLAVYDASQPLAPQFEGIEAVIDQGGSVGTREMMDAATDAKLWQILGTGFDHFDLDYIKQKGIAVANCPGQFSSVALAETAMMFILMLGHRYRASFANFQKGVLYEPTGIELDGQTLGIIGFGASGQDLAIRAKAFGLRIMAIDVREIEPEVLDTIQPDFIGTPDDQDRVISESDYLSLHLHLNAETRHTIDARRLDLMKPTACLINVARGALVDEEALYRALTDGTIGGAGIDAYAQEPPDRTNPVYQLPNVVATPHIAGVTDGTSRKRAACAAENVDRVAQGLEPLYRIDGG
jgi:phosphoglycerate dehydrogenase-like enzyme